MEQDSRIDELRFCPACGKQRYGGSAFCAGCSRAFVEGSRNAAEQAEKVKRKDPSFARIDLLWLGLIGVGLFVVVSLASGGSFGTAVAILTDHLLGQSQTCTVYSDSVNVALELDGPGACVLSQAFAQKLSPTVAQYVQKQNTFAHAVAAGVSAMIGMRVSTAEPGAPATAA